LNKVQTTPMVGYSPYQHFIRDDSIQGVVLFNIYNKNYKFTISISQKKYTKKISYKLQEFSYKNSV